MYFEIFVYLLLFVQLFFVSLVDIKHKKISNQWIYFNVLLTFVLWFLFPEQYVMNSQKILYSLTFIGVGFIFYLMKIMGAGDSKYLASFFMVIPAQWLEMSLYSLLFCTILIGVFVFFTTVVKSHSKLWISVLTKDYVQFAQLINNKFSYAPVIFVSWLVFGFLLFYLKVV